MTQELVRMLLPKHLNRYRMRLEASKRGVDGYWPEALAMLVGIWESIESKDCDPTQFTPQERQEVEDAIHDEMQEE